jgi:23S rRNA pseudouridine2605 synthase
MKENEELNESSDEDVPFLSESNSVLSSEETEKRLLPEKNPSGNSISRDVPKLHKVLADAGVGSRREMEELILAGRISVNGSPAHVGQRINFTDQVRVNGKIIKLNLVPPPIRVLAYHKPVGEIVTRDDPHKRPTVFKKLPGVKSGRWIAVGRLDINTEGLLLFTTSGELANRLMHPKSEIEREYAVRIFGELSASNALLLKEGIELKDCFAKFESVDFVGGSGSNKWVRIVIKEGKRREVRRLFDAVNVTVSRLIRIRYGVVALPPNLKRGQITELSKNAITEISKFVGMKQRNFRPAKPVNKKSRSYDPYKKPNFKQDNLQFSDDNNLTSPNGSSVSIDEDDWQPSGNDAHLSKLGGPMKKIPRGNKKPNPLHTSWGSTTNSNSDALSAPQRLSNPSSKSKKPRPFRSKGSRNRNPQSKS